MLTFVFKLVSQILPNVFPALLAINELNAVTFTGRLGCLFYSHFTQKEFHVSLIVNIQSDPHLG